MMWVAQQHSGLVVTSVTWFWVTQCNPEVPGFKSMCLCGVSMFFLCSFSPEMLVSSCSPKTCILADF